MDSNLKPSLLGLGTAKFGRIDSEKYATQSKIPTDQEILKIFDVCIDHDINVLDTAPAYGNSEERIGKLLGKNRKKFFITTKTGEIFDSNKSTYNFSFEHTHQSIENSLKNLKTDYLDCVFVHLSKNEEDFSSALECLTECKKQGKILNFGASVYSIEKGKFSVDCCDSIMVHFNKQNLLNQKLIEYAHAQDKMVFIKKSLNGGNLSVEENFSFLISTPGITSIVVGSTNPQHIIKNSEMIKQCLKTLIL